jgi:hypothetical protein
MNANAGRRKSYRRFASSKDRGIAGLTPVLFTSECRFLTLKLNSLPCCNNESPHVISQPEFSLTGFAALRRGFINTILRTKSSSKKRSSE